MTRLGISSAALALLLVGVHAGAQTGTGYPGKPVHFVVPSPPGSPPDVVARILGERLAPVLGQPIIVENRPGAIGTIGLHTVSKSPPDGYTFGILSMAYVVAPSLLPKVPYDTVTDLAPVTQVVWGSHVLVVRPTASYKSIEELIEFAKARPGQVTFASGGNGTPAHLSGELFRLRAGIDIRHVPFKSAPAGVAGVLGEQVDLMFAATAPAAPQVRAGKLRALATTVPHRLPAFPELPTMAESGFPGFDTREWTGIVAPAGTPREILARVADEIAKVMSLPDVRERFVAAGMDPDTQRGPEAFEKLIRSETARWAGVVRDAGITVQ
jgi:tripartite-type tricarboxylate transporter receptor subunit TctC